MKKLNLLVLFSLLSLVSCFQTSNSNSNDKQMYSSQEFASAEFSAAYTVLKNNCMSCHTGYHDDWINKTEENDWFSIVDGHALVSSGSLTNSLIIRRLETWGAAGGMPFNSGAISESDYNALKTWIENL